MKRTLLSVCAAAGLMCAGAHPVFVGHRGCDTGVENTADAFKNGVARGYTFMECDVRVTADTQLVISHDADFKRLGAELDIATSTLEQLSQAQLSQLRKTGEYTGTIATLSDFLEICKEGSVTPVIELKWSTGINSDDFSNIPLLISAIEDAGMRGNCIILTSMRPCLEYIRNTWPDIKLQFLGAGNWQQHLPWCITLGLDVDIAHDCLTQDQIDSCHSAGLKVNCWTVDSPERAAELTRMGVDYITTNALVP
ncbi:MAG: hypothetical protein K2M79_04630 [Muribaculaceae bacterium]|nr:hypothetical protein [Muribaculaceae bacterium]